MRVTLRRWKYRAIHVVVLAAISTLLVCRSPSAAEVADSAEIDVTAAAVGEVLAMDDLCRWDLKAKVDQKLTAAAIKLRLNASQQQRLRDRIDAERELVFGNVSAAGRERMRGDICQPEARARIESMVTRFSFD